MTPHRALLASLVIAAAVLAGCVGDDVTRSPAPHAEITFEGQLETDTIRGIFESDGWRIQSEHSPPDIHQLSAISFIRGHHHPEELVSASVSVRNNVTYVQFDYKSTFWNEIDPWADADEPRNEEARAILAPWVVPVLEELEAAFGEPPTETQYRGGPRVPV